MLGISQNVRGICAIIKSSSLITFLFILIISNQSFLFPNPEVDQHVVLGINVRYLKGTGKGFLVIYLAGLFCPNPNLSKVSSAAAFREGHSGLERQFFPHRSGQTPVAFLLRVES